MPAKITKKTMAKDATGARKKTVKPKTSKTHDEDEATGADITAEVFEPVSEPVAPARTRKPRASVRKKAEAPAAKAEPRMGAKAALAVQAALDKKAGELEVLDMSELVSYTDCFIICTGTSSQHAETIADNVEAVLKKSGYRAIGSEGRRGGRWVLMDFGDFIMHVFDRETRDYYGLERLWLDAPRVTLEEMGLKDAHKSPVGR